MASERISSAGRLPIRWITFASAWVMTYGSPIGVQPCVTPMTGASPESATPTSEPSTASAL